MEHTQPALYALVRLHAELGGKIKDNKREAQRLRQSMRHVEAVLHLLDPTFNVRRIAPRRRYNPNPLFKRGHVWLAALDVLRRAQEPMSTEEVSRALLASKGVPEPSRAEVRTMYAAVAASLGNHAGKLVTADEGRPRRWRIIPQ